MNCYLLSSVCIRIMLKMGLHRDPAKLAAIPGTGGNAISTFDGEMRRRIWNLAIQIDLMVSFHMGLPSMIPGIECDTTAPRNLLDEDFDEHCTDLPPGRPATDYTHMTYPVNKSMICRVFGEVAQQAHALTPPAYTDVMRLDSLLEEKWALVPGFMKVRPIDECIADPPWQTVQRFGLASLYQKSRCVLHRRYLVETAPQDDRHAHSRRTCLLAAIALLEYQNSINTATNPGGMLFVTTLAMHDFLLAAMIVYLVIQNDQYSEVGGSYDWTKQDTPLPSKKELMDVLRRSHRIWSEIAADLPDVKKAPEVLEIMFKKIDKQRKAKSKDTLMPDAVSGDSAGALRLGIRPMGNIRVPGELPLTLVIFSGLELTYLDQKNPCRASVWETCGRIRRWLFQGTT